MIFNLHFTWAFYRLQNTIIIIIIAHRDTIQIVYTHRIVFPNNIVNNGSK